MKDVLIQKWRPFSFGRIFLLNISFYCLAGVFFFAAEEFSGNLYRLLLSATLLIITLPLTGLNLTACLEKLARRNFSWTEKGFLATCLALTLPPLAITIFFSLTSIYSPLFSLFFALLIFLLALYLNPFCLDHSINIPRFEIVLFISILISYTLFALALVRAFYALPDLDPYYWLSLYQKDFSQGILTPLHLHRPLFSSLASIFIMTAGIDSYAYFKYLLPCVFLILILPLTLLGTKIALLRERLLIYFFPFVSASFILYTQTPIPQSLLNIGLLLFCISLLCSSWQKDRFFFFFAGFLISIFSFYHEAASIAFFIWLAVALFTYRSTLKLFFSKSPLLISLLLILLTLQIFSLFGVAFSFIFHWSKKILFLLTVSHLNLTYPLSYTNIDGMRVGWSTLEGVIHFYGFYVGPVVLCILSLLVFFWYKKPGYHLSERYSPELNVVLISGLFFFLIAEILPRFFSIALLPERAWGLVALFLIATFFMLYPALRINRLVLFLLYISFLINIGGAFYINTLKKYLITPSQISSAEWIQETLETNALIFSYGNENLLRAHAQATVYTTNDPLFYTKRNAFDVLLKKASFNQSDLHYTTHLYIKETEQSLQALSLLSSTTDEVESLTKEVENIKKQSTDFTKNLQNHDTKKSPTLPPVYVYYAATSPKNPYAKRPYIENIDKTPTFIYDTLPEFKRVLINDTEDIIIWQYNPHL